MPDPTPRFHRHAVGGMEITALADGALHESTGVLHGIDRDAASRLLTEAGLPPDPVIEVSGFLVRSGDTLLLIDAGCGDAMGPGAGGLAASLLQAGVTPDDIDLVLLTHMHPDHLGGLLGPDGAARFQRARIFAPAQDAAVFLNPAIAAAAPKAAKLAFDQAAAVAAAYAGRFETFEGAAELAPGVTALPLPGHSPGHTGYRLTSGADSLLIWGDVVHVPAIQFQRPEVGMVFDADAALAERTRRETFAAAARSREPVAGMHMPFPGLAQVTAVGDAFSFVPLAADQP